MAIVKSCLTTGIGTKARSTPWSAQTFPNVVRSEVRTEHAPMGDAYYTVSGRMPVWACRPGRRCHLLGVLQGAFAPPTGFTGTSNKSWSLMESKKCFFFHGGIPYLGSLVTPNSLAGIVCQSKPLMQFPD